MSAGDDTIGRTLVPFPQLISEQAAAARLDVHPATLVRWRKRGLIGFIQNGRKVRYTEQHLLDYLAQQEVRPCRQDSQAPTDGESARTGSASEVTVPPGAARGSTREHDRLVAHHSALTILKLPRSSSRNGSH